MTEKRSGRRTTNNADNMIQTQAEIRDDINKERLKRFSREYRQSAELEKSLADLSKFVYDPVDYLPALDKKPWVEPVIPDYSYLLTETRLRVTGKYHANIAVQVLLGLFCVIFSLAFRDSFVPFLGAAGFIICTAYLYTTMKQRQQELGHALAATRAIIDARVQEQNEANAQARQAFEDAENARIEEINKLLEGDPGAMFRRMEEVLLGIKLPFFLHCTVDGFNNEPVLTIKLPRIDIIPPTIITLTAAGTCEYEDKTPLAINRQFAEVLASTVVTFAARLYSCLPTLDTFYIRGIQDNWDGTECFFSLKITRETIARAEEWRSGLEAFSALEANYSFQENGALGPITAILPGWWAQVAKEEVRSIIITCQPPA